MDTPDYNTYDIFDQMSTQENLNKLYIKTLMPEATLAGDDCICSVCGKATYIAPVQDGADDFNVVEFCPDGHFINI